MPANFEQCCIKEFYIRYGYLDAKCEENQSRVKLFKLPRKCCQNVISY